jgi:hypothetical protein
MLFRDLGRQISDLAMDCIAKIASLSGEERGTSFIANLTQENPFYEAAPWVAIHRLFRRDFWSRVWIFQELVLPNNLIVGCGSKSLPWSIFKGLDNVPGNKDILGCDGLPIREQCYDKLIKLINLINYQIMIN